LKLPNRVHRIDEQAWQLARPLWWSGYGGGIPPSHAADLGVSYKDRVFEKSGPRWSGVGAGPINASLSQNATRIAVNSWDGFDITYSFLDPTSFGQRNKVKGQFWVDIYDTDSV
jgi:hypothetical protein